MTTEPNIIRFSEVKKHSNEDSVWTVIHNDVYDVTKYLAEHPGGEMPLLEAAGTDSTQTFEDVGHSEDAREIMKKYKIGSLPPGEDTSIKKQSKNNSNLKWAVLALAGAVVIGIVLKKYVMTT